MAETTLSAIEKEERELRLACRFYEQEYPAVDECVVVQVKSIAEMGAYVTLLEYNGIEGMILLSELSRRRIRSVNKLIRVGKTEIAMVMRVDIEKGYIDLSKRRVAREDIIACEERYAKGRHVLTIMRHVAETNKAKLVDLMSTVAWPLAKRYKTTYDAFQAAVTDPEAVFGPLNVPPEILQPLISNIRRRMTPQPVRIRADIDLTCFHEAGVDAVRESLIAGEAAATAEIPLRIKLIAPPIYVILASSLDKKLGLEVVQKSVDLIRAKILEYGGKIVVKQAPYVTSQDDENELAAQLERLELQQREVDGDDDEEEPDE